jgi:hypothetical protein
MSISLERNRDRIKVANIERIVEPTLEDFQQASEVCYTRFEYQRRFDSPARFAAFQKMGVELVVLRDATQAMQCVGFLLPAELELPGEKLTWYYMFQVASRPGVAGAGGLLVRQIMQWYPAIFGMGITPDAEKLYKLFRWQPFEGFWRAVHFINLGRSLADYGSRIDKPWLRTVLQLCSGLYDALSAPVEFVLSLGRPPHPWTGSGGKASVLATYVKVFQIGPLVAADIGGGGRLFTQPDVGSLSQHAALWRALRRRDAKFCEMLITDERLRRSAILLGYVPLPLQVWCWDKQGVLARAIPLLKQQGMTFLDTDKTV